MAGRAAGMITRITNAQGRVLTNLLDDGRMNRLLEQEAVNPDGAYPLAAMLDDVRRGIWAEVYAARPNADAYRRELQGDFLAQIDRKLNPPTTATQAPPQFQFGPPPEPLADDAKSHLRGELVTLRADIVRAIPRTTDRPTKLHLQGAVHRIDTILDPQK